MKNKAKSAQQMNLISKTYALKEQIYREKWIAGYANFTRFGLERRLFSDNRSLRISSASICFR